MVWPVCDAEHGGILRREVDMRIALLLLVLAGAVSGSAQERRARPQVDISGRCGLFLKWVGIRFASDDLLDNPTPQGTMAMMPIEFWRGPFTTRQDARDAAMTAATAGSWGDLIVDGQEHHNDAYAGEFFPAQRIMRTLVEPDCVR